MFGRKKSKNNSGVTGNQLALIPSTYYEDGLIVAQGVCWKCKSPYDMAAVAMMIGKLNGGEVLPETLIVFSFSPIIPLVMSNTVISKFPYFYAYKTKKSTTVSILNNCPRCGVVTSDAYLHKSSSDGVCLNPTFCGSMSHLTFLGSGEYFPGKDELAREYSSASNAAIVSVDLFKIKGGVISRLKDYVPKVGYSKASSGRKSATSNFEMIPLEVVPFDSEELFLVNDEPWDVWFRRRGVGVEPELNLEF